MKAHVMEEQALKVTFGVFFGERGQGHGRNQGQGRGGGRCSFDKSIVKCYNYHELGHFQYECPKKEIKLVANYVKSSEKMLLMAYVNDKEANKEELWFLDSRNSNHMWQEGAFFRF